MWMCVVLTGSLAFQRLCGKGKMRVMFIVTQAKIPIIKAKWNSHVLKDAAFSF